MKLPFVQEIMITKISELMVWEFHGIVLKNICSIFIFMKVILWSYHNTKITIWGKPLTYSNILEIKISHEFSFKICSQIIFFFLFFPWGRISSSCLNTFNLKYVSLRAGGKSAQDWSLFRARWAPTSPKSALERTRNFRGFGCISMKPICYSFQGTEF